MPPVKAPFNLSKFDISNPIPTAIAPIPVLIKAILNSFNALVPALIAKPKTPCAAA